MSASGELRRFVDVRAPPIAAIIGRSKVEHLRYFLSVSELISRSEKVSHGFPYLERFGGTLACRHSKPGIHLPTGKQLSRCLYGNGPLLWRPRALAAPFKQTCFAPTVSFDTPGP
jgi:hypothetical protein